LVTVWKLRRENNRTMEIKGKVHEIGEVRQVSGTFRKRELVVEHSAGPQHREHIKFEAVQDRVGIFDGLSVGDAVTVHFDLRGRPWTDRNGKTSYFNTLRALKVEKDGPAAPAPAAKRYRQTGNAAPVRLGEIVAKSTKEHLKQFR